MAWLTVMVAVPALLDFRPVLRNRSAFAYSLAYCVHTLEMNALRGWGVGLARQSPRGQGHRLESRMRETCQSGSEGGGGFSLSLPHRSLLEILRRSKLDLDLFRLGNSSVGTVEGAIGKSPAAASHGQDRPSQKVTLR